MLPPRILLGSYPYPHITVILVKGYMPRKQLQGAASDPWLPVVRDSPKEILHVLSYDFKPLPRHILHLLDPQEWKRPVYPFARENRARLSGVPSWDTGITLRTRERWGRPVSAAPAPLQPALSLALHKLLLLERSFGREHNLLGSVFAIVWMESWTVYQFLFVVLQFYDTWLLSLLAIASFFFEYKRWACAGAIGGESHKQIKNKKVERNRRDAKGKPPSWRQNKYYWLSGRQLWEGIWELFAMITSRIKHKPCSSDLHIYRNRNISTKRPATDHFPPVVSRFIKLACNDNLTLGFMLSLLSLDSSWSSKH